MVDGMVHAVCEQDAVEELATDPPPVMERLRPTLRDLKDLDAAIASLHHRRIQPSRLLSLLGTMRKVCMRNGGEYGGANPSGDVPGSRLRMLIKQYFFLSDG